MSERLSLAGKLESGEAMVFLDGVPCPKAARQHAQLIRETERLLIECAEALEVSAGSVRCG